ncbi:DUF3102 domain-containing protein [Chelatococcus asaccharovorans]|uniref:DUF3102 domain-containing protein n=1 Tax=Chelatococcus asaccharovorans TaxID=28210 RepID=UPI000D7594D8|nr:DUF3102 domain-containing protein [Chelatococcus asaccharovorans]MBS7704755.1 DUF3102 domain-containing protein [Chelatococcus asaccharovorans]CAH1649911.1 hypothetical protein CHELA40_10291 [Chelatococcus asaccharovorans]CAH1686862.1 hypothetical protein CHELA17_65319 [Chelatococcus asaccharovorans]
MQLAAESIIEIGLALIRQKQRLPHRMFLPWIEAGLGMAERSARRFMEVTTALGSKSAKVADLPPTAL